MKKERLKNLQHLSDVIYSLCAGDDFDIGHFIHADCFQDRTRLEKVKVDVFAVVVNDPRFRFSLYSEEIMLLNLKVSKSLLSYYPSMTRPSDGKVLYIHKVGRKEPSLNVEKPKRNTGLVSIALIRALFVDYWASTGCKHCMLKEPSFAERALAKKLKVTRLNDDGSLNWGSYVIKDDES